MALHLLPLEEVRTATRQRLEACELWLRRLVHDQLAPSLGEDFLLKGALNGQAILSREVRERIAGRVSSQPQRYPRAVALRPGLTLRCEVEVDAHYLPSDYEIRWNVGGSREESTGPVLVLHLGPSHVGESLYIEAKVISKKPWHRYRLYDAEFFARYRVLPPL